MGALWPLHPDLTGMNISYAILFLLSPHSDLSQLLSDLEQEFIDSQKWRNLTTGVPFSRHVAENSPGWLGGDGQESTCDKQLTVHVVTGERKSHVLSEVTCVSSSLWARASFWAESSWFWHSDSCSFSWTHSKTTKNRGYCCILKRTHGIWMCNSWFLLHSFLHIFSSASQELKGMSGQKGAPFTLVVDFTIKYLLHLLWEHLIVCLLLQLSFQKQHLFLHLHRGNNNDVFETRVSAPPT